MPKILVELKSKAEHTKGIALRSQKYKLDCGRSQSYRGDCN